MKTDDLKYHLLYWPVKALAQLPLWMLYGVSSFAALVLGDVVKYRRGVIDGNLRKAFPEADDGQIARWRRRFYHHLCDIFVEAVKLLGISNRQVDRRVKVENAEIVDKAIEQGQSVVLFLGHYGNWEWVPAITRHFNNQAIMAQIYHPLSSRPFDRLMLKIRSRFGSESITMANTFRRLVQIERSGKKFVTGFISDQRPVGQHLDNWTDFLGIDTPFISGGEVIGNHLNCRYIYLDVEPQKRGHYKLTFREIEPVTDG